MGTVHRLTSAGDEAPPLGEAIAAWLMTFAEEDRGNTVRAYGQTLGQLREEFGAGMALDEIDPDSFAIWFTDQWGSRSHATWNAALSRIRAAARYWQEQQWVAADCTRRLRRRKQERDSTRAMDKAEVEQLLTKDGIALRERLLWRMLYETAARSAEVLGLDVNELDMPARRARVRRKGGATDWIVWKTGTARLLPRYLKGRTKGPLFLTERRARVELSPADIDPASGRARLSYQQAEAIFKQISGGRTLHQWRHSALTHDAASGVGTPLLMVKSGHTNPRTLAQYARPTVEDLAAFQAATDPARRKR